MTNLTPYRKHTEATLYNPFRELEEFERSIFAPDTLASFRADIEDEGDNLILSADLPGFDKKDIQIDIDDDRLVIRAERHSNYEKKDKKNGFLRCERSFGSYSRSFDVSGIDCANIKAAYKDGVLTMTLPKQKKEEPTGRRLEIE